MTNVQPEETEGSGDTPYVKEQQPVGKGLFQQRSRPDT